ncbi:flavodoxin [Bacillus chungangensis]|uniref:Flavodoxin n=1 Tax=Bacillus chungangensis TaxID=587633 RepID=A0ABT9WRV4_9BACI|nr:flavodoxin [Bacillus chungangensis]MDQ0175637.1 flavodoxin I [Bacillus chungangensis]
MKKIILVFTSMTGNTEMMAEVISEAIQAENMNVIIKDSLDAYADELLDYDGILFGSHTYEDGAIPDEFMGFYEEMEGLYLGGKAAAVFGSGDRFYPKFAKAVDSLTERLRELGASIVLDSLKVDLTPEDEDLERCRAFGKQFADIVNKQSLKSALT